MDLLMKDIEIEFSGFRALKSVEFQAKSGCVTSLVGANGAGKSTLMKILSGVYPHYSGKIFIGDNEVNIKGPNESKESGVQIVAQEVDTALIPYLTVGENIMLEYYLSGLKGKVFVDYKYIHESSQRLLDKIGIDLNTKDKVENLTLAQKQMVLIARALSRKCKFLILDEPTAPLSTVESEKLFSIIDDLKENGVGIIFISHRLREVMKISDSIVVLRDGYVSGVLNPSSVDEKDITKHMIGEKHYQSYSSEESVKDEVAFEVRNLRDKFLKDINMTLKKGEILGIAGLVGAGKTELCKALFGCRQAVVGEIYKDGKKVVIKSPRNAVNKGIALIPEERRKEGILVDEDISVNLTSVNLDEFTSYGFININKIKEKSYEMINALSIKTRDEKTKLRYLSGGNQQKVVIGKWILKDCDVYIFDEPTKGVDIGAKEEIFALIGELSKKGKAIIYASCEIGEILSITNRMYVMYDGKIQRELVSSKTTEEEILLYSTGGKVNEG
ncbi:sugar ABC transporter ATP-binding protein [Clostridium cylindrosporum]|uniref:ABC-type sugar transport system, ATPase component n=1 Tax=Clostridium cylindrosporum DSM 605 TaxID=1121307 RepID=A0A0J8DED7_CLOCY|nr:sugar ABC transporter ATP-binding protein [Clostridium cylindrosporum]KMT22558.1 ABC-type sugar transport system, ATPase component [Clostridium cylindrosporum DSM 605]